MADIDIHGLFRESLGQVDKWRKRALDAVYCILDASGYLDPHPPKKPDDDAALECLEKFIREHGNAWLKEWREVRSRQGD